MAEPVHDNAESLEKIKAFLVSGEQVEAVFDSEDEDGMFLAITSSRLLVPTEL